MKREYIDPEFTTIIMMERDIICSSDPKETPLDPFDEDEMQYPDDPEFYEGTQASS